MQIIKKQNMVSNSAKISATVTLKDLLYENLDIFCWCSKCYHNSVLKTKQIINKLGPSYPIAEVRRYLKCKKCNNTKDLTIRPNWPINGGQITRHMT